MDEMTSKTMIEEMAKDMLDYGMDGYPTFDSVFTESKLREQVFPVFLGYAERLIKKGYCKIHEGSVVLTKEEHEKLEALRGDYVKGYEAGVDEGWNNARKESIDEFVAKVKERMEPLIEQARDMAARNHRHGFTIMACMWRSEMVAMLTDIEILEQVAKEITEGKDDDTSQVGK